jgi:hypothetical protein
LAFEPPSSITFAREMGTLLAGRPRVGCPIEVGEPQG